MSSSGLKGVRSYLIATSERERPWGVPVGGILMKKSLAGNLKKEWHKAKLGKIGTKHFQEILEAPDYAVVHVSTHTAAKISALRLNGEYARVEDVLTVLEGEYFPGIRINDQYFAPKKVLAAAAENDQYRFTFGEIFAGIGGFRLGLEPLGGRCVFASEIDSEAQKTYAENFGISDLIGDITGHYAQDLPSHDILTAGFPCQSFSCRGEQKGLNDPRGQLYNELVRVLSMSRPKVFIFENVANLVVINGGKRGNYCSPAVPDIVGSTFSTILDDFERTGYQVAWKIVNSRHWLPQNRERVFIVGFRNDLGIDPKSKFDWNLNRQDPIYNTGKGRGLLSTVRDILVPSDFEDMHHCVLTETQRDRITSIEFLKKSFPLEVAHNKLTGRENWINIDGKSPTLVSGYHNLSSFSTKYVFHEPDGSLRDLPRFFNHLECKRIMGFPDSFKVASAQYGTFYKQIGNAVCPPVIHAIGAEVLRLLEESTESSGDVGYKRPIAEEDNTSSVIPNPKKMCSLDNATEDGTDNNRSF